MKSLVIQVSEDFVIPQLFEDDNPVSIRELALTIGAKAAQGIKESRLTHERNLDGYTCELITLQEELRKSREEAENQRSKIREELQQELKVKQREALLSEKEKFANEKETLIARIEERHAAQLLVTEKRHSENLQEQRQTLDQLRREHEGLVLKLMTRLEMPAPRSAINAPTLGRTFEENVQRHLRQAFGARPGFQLEDVHSSGHCGDLLMIFDELRILIELKSYDPKTRVPTKEVEKLARDLSEVEPRCDAAIMISACSEITGHYSCGALEVSTNVACVPVLFINNFLTLGEPQVTLHMTRVFLSMIQIVNKSVSRIEKLEAISSSDEIIDRLKAVNSECARRCTAYLTDLNRQSSDLLHQATAMKNGALKLRETVIVMIENEVSRFNGIIQLMAHGVTPEEAVAVDILPDLDGAIFSDPSSMSPGIRDVATKIASSFAIGDQQQRCPTKEILDFIQSQPNIKTQKSARDALKAIFLEDVVKHGYILGVAKKGA